jgi:hypothetical protein
VLEVRKAEALNPVLRRVRSCPNRETQVLGDRQMGKQSIVLGNVGDASRLGKICVRPRPPTLSLPASGRLARRSNARSAISPNCPASPRQKPIEPKLGVDAAQAFVPDALGRPSGRFQELDCHASGGNALQQCTIDVGAFEVVDFKT